MILEMIGAIPFPDWINDTAIALGPIRIKWYGLGYVVGAYLAFYYALRTTRKPHIWEPAKKARASALIPDRKTLEDFLFYCFLLGICIGGRLGYVLFYGGAGYFSQPLRIFKVWEGGMSFHGGFLGVCAVTWWLTKRRNIPLMRMADMAAIGAPIGIFLVRLANFANQELYGRRTEVPWAFRFDTDPAGVPRHPSQLYEAFLEGVVIFVILWFASRKCKALTRPGLCSGIFIFLYGCFRIFVEFFREPDAELFGPLTRGMGYSLPMVIVGVLLIRLALKKAPFDPYRVPAGKNENA